MKARHFRTIRRCCQRHSQHRNGLGVSELFLAPSHHVEVILGANDLRLKRYLLGFSDIPPCQIGAHWV